MTLPTRILRKTAGMLASALCRQRNRAAILPIQAAFNEFKYRFENVDFNFDTNGEGRVLRKLALTGPKIIFDVGANTGDYAQLAGQICPAADIHSFEPLPATFEILKKGLPTAPRFHLNNFGLGASEQVIQLHHQGAGDVQATAFPFESSAPGRITSVRIIRGDAYAKSAGVTKVDFLKIDVEGMELEVMKGFGDFLRTSVDCLQFEYGVFNIVSRYMLRDLCSLLTEQGFAVGKVYPRHVEFFNYDYTREDFLGNNFVAVRKERPDLIKLLK
jgi:FkbM family methyltransferase